MENNLKKSELQEKWSEEAIKQGVSGLYSIAPRVGKCRLALRIAQKIKAKKILVVYPDNKIKNSWIKDVENIGFEEEIVYTTYLSLYKCIEKYDIIFFDEIHASSEAQREEMKKLLKINNKWIGLSGSLSKDTIRDINQYFKAKIIVEYPIELAIEDGIISNYEIHIVSCKLDTKILSKNTKGKMLSEKEKYNNYTYVIESLMRQGKPVFMLLLARMRLLQSSIGKFNKTKELLAQYKDKRILIFAGLTKTADSLGVNVHHSKDENEKDFIDFAEGTSKFNHFCVCRIGKAGITFRNLDMIILNSFDGNEENTAQKICRCLLLEEDLDKVSHIYIICSNEEAELKKLKKSLKMFRQSKISYE